MNKTIQRPLACRNAHCGAMCSPADASFLGNTKECYKYECRDDLYTEKSIPLEKIKQAREEIEKIQLQGVNTGVIMQKDVLEILDKLIESEV